MEVFGITTPGKAGLVAFCWASGAVSVWWGLELGPEQKKENRRSGETLFIRVVSFLPTFVVRWFYVLFGVGLFVIPLLALVGVTSWH